VAVPVPKASITTLPWSRPSRMPPTLKSSWCSKSTSASASAKKSARSVNASLQQMAIGLAAVVAGAVVGETESGVITGYSTVGLIAAVSIGVSVVLVGRLRLARGTVESSVAVDPPGDSLAFTASEASFLLFVFRYVVTLQADLPSGAYQQTKWIYGVTTSGGNGLNSNDIVSAVQHPDKTTGNPSSSERDSQAVDALGETLTATDRNGNVQTLTLDVLGERLPGRRWPRRRGTQACANSSCSPPVAAVAS